MQRARGGSAAALCPIAAEAIKFRINYVLNQTPRSSQSDGAAGGKGGEVVGSDGCANCKLSAGSRCLVGIMRRWAREMREERRKWEQRTVKKTQRTHTHTEWDTHKYTSKLHSLLAMRVRAGTLDSAGQDNNSLVSTFCWSNKGEGVCTTAVENPFAAYVHTGDTCHGSVAAAHKHKCIYVCVCVCEFVFAYWHAVIIMYNLFLFHHILATRSGNAALMQSTKWTPLVVAVVCHFATTIRPFMKEKKPSEE